MNKHVISFSGGIGSFWAARRVIEQHGTDGVVLLFADTLIEDEDLYRFMDDAALWLSVPITRIADGRDPWQVFNDVRLIGNTKADPCSRILKRELIWKWIKANAPTATVYLGIDWTEDHRLLATRANHPEYAIEAPMCDRPLMSKPDMIRGLAEIGIKPPRLYGMGFAHNNCGGFCVKSGQAQFALLLKTMPERYAHHEAKETEMRAYLGKNVAILRDRRGGKTRPMSLRKFRERLEAQPDLFDKDEWGGCGCALG
jgi:hypothetical protein